MWGATIISVPARRQNFYFNPRSPCGERHSVHIQTTTEKTISIHAPRVGSDEDFSFTGWKDLLFQSTLPVWGATGVREELKKLGYISIHAPRVGSDQHHRSLQSIIKYFNPRSPCGERPIQKTAYQKNMLFQSTLPVWGATRAITAILQGVRDFNPRSPCGERHTRHSVGILLINFNPRSPCGERPFKMWQLLPRKSYFNPRSPCGERQHQI